MISILLHDFSDNLVMLKKGKVYAIGSPNELLSERNIRDVYGVDALVDELYG